MKTTACYTQMSLSPLASNATKNLSLSRHASPSNSHGQHAQAMARATRVYTASIHICTGLSPSEILDDLWMEIVNNRHKMGCRFYHPFTDVCRFGQRHGLRGTVLVAGFYHNTLIRRLNGMVL